MFDLEKCHILGLSRHSDISITFISCCTRSRLSWGATLMTEIRFRDLLFFGPILPHTFTGGYEMGERSRDLRICTAAGILIVTRPWRVVPLRLVMSRSASSVLVLVAFSSIPASPLLHAHAHTVITRTVQDVE